MVPTLSSINLWDILMGDSSREIIPHRPESQLCRLKLLIFYNIVTFFNSMILVLLFHRVTVKTSYSIDAVYHEIYWLVKKKKEIQNGQQKKERTKTDTVKFSY